MDQNPSDPNKCPTIAHEPSDRAESVDRTAMAIEGPEAVIGSYALVEILREGGFGTVWQARQEEPVKREVALKVNKTRTGFRRGDRTIRTGAASLGGHGSLEHRQGA